MSGLFRAIVAAASLFIATSSTLMAQPVPPKLPFAISCYIETSGTWVVGYLSDVNEDGSATYMPPGGRVSLDCGCERYLGSSQQSRCRQRLYWKVA